MPRNGTAMTQSPPSQPVSVAAIRGFWEREPVGAAAIDAEPGTKAFFNSFDRIREDPDMEPPDLQERNYALSAAAGKTVFDYGCGNGFVLQQFARNGATVHGVDLTERSIALCRARFADRGLEGSFVVGDGRSIPHPDATFDMATSMGVLHHIPDPTPVVADLYRVVKPGGRLTIMLYYRYSWQCLVLMPLKRLFYANYRGKSQAEAVNMVDGDENPYGVVYSRREAIALLEAAGFRVLDTELYHLTWRQFLMVGPVWRVAEALFGPLSRSWVCRRLGWALYLRAEKPA